MIQKPEKSKGKLKNKVVFIVSACLMAGCFLSPLDSPGNEMSENIYTDPLYGFRLVCPDSDWTVTDQTGIPEVLCIVASKTGMDGFVPNVTVSIECLSHMMTAAEYGEQNRKSLIEKGYDITSSGTVIIHRTVFYVLECCNETTSTRFEFFCLVKNRIGFVLACSAPKNTYKQYRDAFGRVVTSFRFL